MRAKIQIIGEVFPANHRTDSRPADSGSRSGWATIRSFCDPFGGVRGVFAMTDDSPHHCHPTTSWIQRKWAIGDGRIGGNFLNMT